MTIWAENNLLGLLLAIVTLWHIVGFGFGLVYVTLSVKSLFKIIPYDRKWSRVIRSSDIHLWLSGIFLIAIGIMQKSLWEYISNPKLMSKVTIVIIWMISTQMMRWIGVPELKKDNPRPMVYLSAINLSCWIYGAFLGCAKNLSYGLVSYSEFILGFLILSLIIFFIMKYINNIVMEKKRTK